MKALIQELAKTKIELMEKQRQLDAAEVIIKTLTKRLAEREFKNEKADSL